VTVDYPWGLACWMWGSLSGIVGRSAALAFWGPASDRARSARSARDARAWHLARL